MLVLSAAVLCYAALGAVLGILPSLAGDRAMLGLLVGAPALTAVITRPLGGRLADRVGSAPVLASGAGVMALGVLPALVSSGTVALLASRLAVGAGEGAMMSATVLWLLRLAGPAHRGRALGHIGLANYAGLTVGPLLAVALGSARTPVLVAAALLPLAGAVLPAGVRRPKPERQEGGAPVWRAIVRPGAGLMLVNVGYVALLAFGARVAGSVLAVPVFAAGVILVRTLGGNLPDRFGAHLLVPITTGLAAAGLVAVALAGAPVPALGGTAILAVGQGLAVPVLGLIALERVPAARHGAAAGLFFSFFDAGVGAGGPAVGEVARLSSPSWALIAAAGAVACAGLIQRRA